MELEDLKTRGNRLRYVRENLFHNFSKRDFAIQIGVDPGQYKRAEDDQAWIKNKLSVLSKMGVNLHWLETGDGEPMLKGKETLIVSEPEAVYGNKPVVYNPKSEPFYQERGEKKLTYGSDIQILPIVIDNEGLEYVSIVGEPARASYNVGFRDISYIRQLPIETIPEDLRGRGTIRKFEIDGSSMAPLFMHGDWVYCSYKEFRTLNDLNLEFKERKLFVISTVNYGLIFKFIQHHHDDEFITCHSINKDENPPFRLHVQEVKEWWYVRRRYTGNFNHSIMDKILIATE